jgi:hypothetical protein
MPWSGVASDQRGGATVFGDLDQVVVAGIGSTSLGGSIGPDGHIDLCSTRLRISSTSLE